MREYSNKTGAVKRVLMEIPKPERIPTEITVDPKMRFIPDYKKIKPLKVMDDYVETGYMKRIYDQ